MTPATGFGPSSTSGAEDAAGHGSPAGGGLRKTRAVWPAATAVANGCTPPQSMDISRSPASRYTPAPVRGSRKRAVSSGSPIAAAVHSGLWRAQSARWQSAPQ